MLQTVVAMVVLPVIMVGTLGKARTSRQAYRKPETTKLQIFPA